MEVTYETNEYGEQVKVITYSNGYVIKELVRPILSVEPDA